ncbi:hypothetical protein HK096_007385 [Nowakowskiella sp. JEL0078]|nr:hypothetical protein HK096_007385 [Nowakowskiella sp. JEL0078]
MVFSGSFTSGPLVYHILDIATYRRLKQGKDVEIASPLSRPRHLRRARMIIYTDMEDEALDSLVVTDPLTPTWHSLGRRELVMQDGKCGVRDPIVAGIGRLGRRAVLTGCPTNTKVLFMAAAGDCGYVQAQGSEDKALATILSNWNSVSAVYQSQFNIQLGLINVTLLRTCTASNDLLKWNQGCSTSYEISDRLSDFSRWRGTLGNDNAGLWHLVTVCGTGTSVGVAWLGAVCQQNSTMQTESGITQYVSGTAVSVASTSGWRVVAHEIGHSILERFMIVLLQLVHALDQDVHAVRARIPVTVVVLTVRYYPGDIPQVTQNICGNGIKEDKERNNVTVVYPIHARAILAVIGRHAH